jgi:hypothetical protein
MGKYNILHYFGVDILQNALPDLQKQSDAILSASFSG